MMGIIWSCTRVEDVGAPSNTPIAEGGGTNDAEGAAGSSAGEARGGVGGDVVTLAGAPSSAPVALWPTYAAPASSAEAGAALAAVAALSAGSLLLPVSERWDTLSGPRGSPRAATWQRLAAMVEPYRQRDGELALCIGVVDRASPAWPFASDLTSDAALSAMRRTIDEVYARYAGELSLLCFGYQVDRYWQQASPSERSALGAFLAAAVEYASEHRRRSRTRTSVGVAVSLETLGAEPLVDVDELRLGDVVVAVYDPLDGDHALKAPASIEDEVAAAVATIAGRDAERRPLVLMEVGYPTSRAVGSSQALQREFVERLVSALDGAGDAVSGAYLNGLNDGDGAACEAEALAFRPLVEGEAGQVADERSIRALVRCSMGLRAENAEPKLAWPTALDALSRE
jgi:hypothetical protein